MFRNSLDNDAGSAFVETALVLPLLLLIVMGAAELGRIAYAAVEVANAARAGAAYGAQSTLTASETGTIASGLNDQIAVAAVADAADFTAGTVQATASNSCVCQTTNSITGAVTSSAPISCTSSTAAAANYCQASATTGVTNTIIQYVQVNTDATVKSMFKYPGLPTSYTLNGSATMRVAP